MESCLEVGLNPTPVGRWLKCRLPSGRCPDGRHPPPVSATSPLMCSHPPTANRQHLTFAPLHRTQADLHFCTQVSTQC
jgi:hypothetical protein